jgi:nucleoid DNA-binding protein
MSTVTRRELATALKQEYGGTIQDNDNWILAFIDILSRKISEEGRVEIRGFGSFNLSTIKAHTTVNPGIKVKAGEKREKTHIPETYTVDFRASRILKDQLRKDQAAKKKAEAKSKKKSKKRKSSKRARKNDG